jgi:hypothetical protein
LLLLYVLSEQRFKMRLVDRSSLTSTSLSLSITKFLVSQLNFLFGAS